MCPTPPTSALARARKDGSRLLAAITLTTLIAVPNDTKAQDKQPLSAAESDPIAMGWMQGSPPPDDKIVSAADGSFFEFPALRYSVAHMRQFTPTVAVSRGAVPISKLPYALDEAIDALEFTPRGGSETMTWAESLPVNYTDGIVVLHRGQIVYETYAGALTEAGEHAAMSCSKSFAGTLAATLAAEGALDTAALVTKYVPELANSAFGNATVREVMDMTTSLDYSEDYADPKAEIWQYAAAGDPFPKPDDYDGPVGYLPYLQTLKADGEHGEAFTYKTPNADVVGWIVARVAGKSLNEVLAERIWSKLGMEQSGYYQVDAQGTPSAGGGLNGGLRDLARFGEMIRGGGVYNGERILPEAAIADIRKGGSKAAFAKSDHPGLPGWSYRNLWWITENEHGAFAARGVYGQTIYIDPAAEMTIVRFASNPVAANAANDDTSLPAYSAVADYLMGKK